MSVAERSAAYRARRKAELEAAGKAPVVRIRFRPNRSTASCGLTATAPRAVGSVLSVRLGVMVSRGDWRPARYQEWINTHPSCVAWLVFSRFSSESENPSST
jgi:hypothetical protein